MTPCPCKNTHANTLACERCLEGHLGYAAVLSIEAAEDSSRVVERRLCLGNLKAAEQHARALGRDALRATIREARHAFAAGDTAPVLALLSIPLSAPSTPSTPSTSSTTPTPGEF